MRRREFLKRILATTSMSGLAAIMLTAGPSDAVSADFPTPSKKDRCPVCGMFVYKYPKWAAGFVFKSGAHYFHCCPKCMLHNLLNIPKYQPGEIRDNLVQIWVTDYYATRKMDARDAVFVVGTNLVGPMGADIVPVAGRGAAENLKKDYQGETIVTLDEITPEVVERARTGKMK
ncbi:MAG: nitrous oxide reductase accessory protein NosL [Thermodesulfobacteriota bacterium]